MNFIQTTLFCWLPFFNVRGVAQGMALSDLNILTIRRIVIKPGTMFVKQWMNPHEFSKTIAVAEGPTRRQIKIGENARNVLLA